MTDAHTPSAALQRLRLAFRAALDAYRLLWASRCLGGALRLSARTEDEMAYAMGIALTCRLVAARVRA